MDIEAFTAVAREILQLQPYDQWLVGYGPPTPSTENPTQETLDALTEKVIEYEGVLAAVPAELDRLDDLGSRLNYYYDAAYAAQEDPTGSERSDAAPSIVRWRYETCTARLAETRATLNGQVQVFQALLSTYTAARAKVEHDLQWQEYVREQFGVDPAAIPRAVKAASATDIEEIAA